MRDFVIESTMGQRNWMANDADHAIEQHVDAFPEEPILYVDGVPIYEHPAALRFTPQKWAIIKDAVSEGIGGLEDRAAEDLGNTDEINIQIDLMWEIVDEITHYQRGVPYNGH